MRHIWIAVFLLLSLITAGHCVSTQDIARAQSEALDLEELEQEAKEYTGDVDIAQGVDLQEGLDRILDTGNENLHGAVKKAVRSGVLLLSAVLLCGVADGLYIGVPERGGAQSVQLVGTLAVTAIAVIDVNSLLGLGTAAIEKISDFSNLLLPVVAAVTAATGAISGASARQLAAVVFSDLLVNLISRLLIPLVYAYLIACIAYAAVGNDGMKRISALFKWVVTTILAAVMLAFIGYLTVSGVIAGTADAATIKAAKFAVSSAVPVVGGILSDASETVLASAGVLKSSIGVFGMLTVLSMCLVPFLYLGIHYLAYKLSAALASTVAEGRMAGLIDQIGAAFGMILGMMGATALLLLISLVSSVSVAAV